MTLENIMVIDTETGGVNSLTDALCSVTMKVYDKDDIIETIFIKPQKKLNYSETAMEINGLTLEILEEKGVSEIEAIGRIVQFINKNFSKNPNILGQNGGFDVDFLNQLMIRNNMHSFNSLIWHQKRDTEVVSRFLQDIGIGPEKVNLGEAYKFFTGVELKDAHTSEADVIGTEALYKAQMSYLKNKLK